MTIEIETNAQRGICPCPCRCGYECDHKVCPCADCLAARGVRDPHGLLTAGAELADEKTLARRLNVSRSVLGPLLQGELYRRVRHVREGARRLYSVEDARREIAPFLPAIAERRRVAEEREARERIEGAARRQAKAAAHAAHVARKHGPPTRPAAGSGGPPPLPSQGKRNRPARSILVPEVFVRRRAAT